MEFLGWYIGNKTIQPTVTIGPVIQKDGLSKKTNIHEFRFKNIVS